MGEGVKNLVTTISKNKKIENGRDITSGGYLAVEDPSQHLTSKTLRFFEFIPATIVSGWSVNQAKL